MFDIEKSHKLYPNTTLCGDDFTTKPGVNKSVKEFCDKNGLKYEVSENQWIIKKEIKNSSPKLILPKLKKVTSEEIAGVSA